MTRPGPFPAVLTDPRGQLGMSDAEYAEVLDRAGEPEPGAAKAYAATHRVLCAHADQDGRSAHWLQPGEKCAAAEADQDRAPDDDDAALPAAAAYIRDVAAELEAGS